MKWLTFDLRTGRKLRYLPTKTGGKWTSKLNSAGSLSCTVPFSRATPALNLWESTREWRTGLAAVDGDVVLQAGPIVPPRDWTGRSITLQADGIAGILDQRAIIPAPLAAMEIAGPIDEDDPDWTITFSGSYSDVIRGMILNAMAVDGGELPVVLPEVTGGTHVLPYKGFDFASVWQRIHELTQRMDGPQVRFDPRFNEDRDGIEFVLRVGSEAEPYLGGSKMHRWSQSAAKSPISNLQGSSVDDTRVRQGSLGWSVGGRQSEATVVVKRRDSWLTDRGWPLMDVIDRDHLNATETSTLDSYLAARLERSRRTSDVFMFDVQRDTARTARVGDNVDMPVKDHPILPDGPYRLRITSMSGSDSDQIHVEAVQRG